MEYSQQTTTDTIDSNTKHTVESAVSEITSKSNPNKPQKEVFHFDRLKMYFGEPFNLTDNLTIYEPTIGNILNFGEMEFFQTLNIFISHPTQYRVKLWESGIDQNKISDYDFFSSLVTGVHKESTKLLFGDADFSKFKVILIPISDEEKKQNEDHKDDKEWKIIEPQKWMINQEQKIVITEHDYKLMAEYLRNMFNIFPKVEKARGRSTKESIIEEDKARLEAEKNDPKNNGSFLLPLVSACINHPGFKYKLQELRDVGIVQFMDSVERLQIYESTRALTNGMYSGMCDLSKVDKQLFNFMRDTHEK